MTAITKIISSVASFGGSIASFISSAKSTYILIGIISIGGAYMWNDYQSLRADNGKLTLALSVASSGTRQALTIADSNATEAIKIQTHYQEILNELSRMGETNRALQEALSDKEAEIDKFTSNSTDSFKECLAIQLPEDIFGNLVKPDSGSTVVDDKL
jgi:hypothetical protein